MTENNKKNKSAVFIMGGGLINDSGTWRTTNYDEGDKFGVSGDSAIVAAAALLFADHPEWLFIASGSRGQYKDIINAPNVSTVIKNELIRLGIPAGNIVEENNSKNTYQQLQNLQVIHKKNNFDKIFIIGNKHTQPRLQAMIEYKKELAELKSAFSSSCLKSISAEEILLDKDPDTWKNIIETAYASEAMKKRVALENQGARQVKEGTYKFIEN